MFGVNVEEIIDELTMRIERLEKAYKNIKDQNNEDKFLEAKIQTLEEVRAWLSVKYL
jgi:hypothetical protein